MLRTLGVKVLPDLRLILCSIGSPYFLFASFLSRGCSSTISYDKFINLKKKRVLSFLRPTFLLSIAGRYCTVDESDGMRRRERAAASLFSFLAAQARKLSLPGSLRWAEGA